MPASKPKFKFPEQVAVLGVDNDPVICDCVQVPLSSVRHDLEGMAYEAAALLDRLINGEPPPKIPKRIPPKGVVTRKSTEVLAVEDPEVARALSYIQANFARGAFRWTTSSPTAGFRGDHWNGPFAANSRTRSFTKSCG